MGFEPTTSTLARLRSTPELRPHGGAPRRAAAIIRHDRRFATFLSESTGRAIPPLEGTPARRLMSAP